jgi:hypothetical protein
MDGHTRLNVQYHTTRRNAHPQHSSSPSSHAQSQTQSLDEAGLESMFQKANAVQDVPRRYGRTVYPDTRHITVPIAEAYAPVQYASSTSVSFAPPLGRSSLASGSSEDWGFWSDKQLKERRAQTRQERYRRNADRVVGVADMAEERERLRDERHTAGLARQRMRYLQAVTEIDRIRQGVA